MAAQRDGHFLSVCRYVERNALRANLVKPAQNWRWSSLWLRANNDGPMHGKLAAWPMPIPSDWIRIVNRAQSQKELDALRLSRDRGRPYGDAAWTAATARRLKLQSSLRPVGHPAKRRDGEKRGNNGL